VGQKQARPRAAAGACSSKAGTNVACVHQQGGCGWPLARASSMAQPFAPPHRGQRLGSIGVGAGVMAVLF